MLTRVIRLRLARSLGRVRPFSSAQTEVPPLPPLSSLHLPTDPVGPYPLYRSPPPPSSPAYSELPDSLDGLPSDKSLQLKTKQRLTRAVVAELEEYTEEELREFYAAVVQSSAEALAAPEGKGKARLAGPSGVRQLEAPRGKKERGGGGEVLRGLAERFAPASGEGAASSKAVGSRAREDEGGVREIVDRLARFLEEEELSAPGPSTGAGVRVPLGLVSRVEGRALLAEAVREGDASALVALMELLPRLGVQIERKQIGALLAEAVSTKDAGRLSEGEQEVVAMLCSMIGQQAELLPAEHDVLARVHLVTDHSATTAISHLRHFESLSLPAPQSTYNLILQHLTTSSPSSTSRSLAWDLFAHMRLVAHPLPLPSVYSTMIASCAASSDPRPEMARDLWIQMTQEERLDPTEPEYTAYIRALCSTRGTYLEGFDVFRQMLARHEEATYVPFAVEGEEEMRSRYIPTNETWKALLEGTKRAGDLARARWVLSECVRLHAALGGQRGAGVDDEVMASVFMTYAAWKPVLKRMVVKESEEKADSAKNGDAVLGEAEAEQRGVQQDAGLDEYDLDGQRDLEAQTSDGGQGMFAARVPTTSAEAIREAQLLYDALSPSVDPTSSRTVFSDVRRSTRLINSYLSVIYAHSSTISECKEDWDGLTPDYTSGGGRNGWSYLHALERCSMGQRSRSSGAEDRAEALAWAKQLWRGYITVYDTLLQRLYSPTSIPGLAHSLGISPRQVERCWRAIIRVHALNDETTPALSLLTDFHTRFPPSHILHGYAPATEHGFQMRFTDPTTVPEADVPPHLLFKDVDVLHQRLVRDERYKEVGTVKWVCQGYEAALAKRRRWRLEGVGRARARKARLGLGRIGASAAQVMIDGDGEASDQEAVRD